MSTDLAVIEPKEIELVKRTVATGATDDELKLYFYDCQRRGVHPLDKLIHFTKRGGKYVPITSIDFMRQRATASGAYAGKAPTVFNGTPGTTGFQAMVVVHRIVQGIVCNWTATARWSEYFPGEQQGHMWKKMPHVMLEKCAEALALRQAFPNELQGLYTKEEMEQAADDKPKPQGSLRDRVMKQVVVDASQPQAIESVQAETVRCTTTPMEEAGPLPARVPPSQPPVVALPPPSTEPEYDWQLGLVTKIEKAPKLTAKGQPFGTITLETIDGKEITATWFGFSAPWTYEMIREQLCGRTLEVEFVLTPASNPRYKPTLEHFRCSEAAQ